MTARACVTSFPNEVLGRIEYIRSGTCDPVIDHWVVWIAKGHAATVTLVMRCRRCGETWEEEREFTPELAAELGVGVSSPPPR